MYSTLWHTALDFHENYEKWYSGPVSQLKSDAIKTKARQNVNAFEPVQLASLSFDFVICFFLPRKLKESGTTNIFLAGTTYVFEG